MNDEKQLIERAQRGEMAAFRELVERHKKNVYFLALDLCGNHHDAEDVAQEVFIRAFKFLAKFRGESRLNTWLYRITVNCFIDSKRKKQVMTISMNEDREEENRLPESALADEHSPTPEDSAQASGIQADIQKALNSLSPRERSVFVLRHYKDLPLKEIGQTLNIAEGTVKSLLFRAIQRLQKELAFYRADLGLNE